MWSITLLAVNFDYVVITMYSPEQPAWKKYFLVINGPLIFTLNMLLNIEMETQNEAGECTDLLTVEQPEAAEPPN